MDGLHRARIAHRSLRAANIVVDRAGRPWIVDFSFSELGATQRQMALDVAELLASLATLIGADRAAGSAAAVIGPDGVAAAVPLLQPLALSAGTRRAIARHDGLLTQTRAAAAAASGREDQELARLQRVRPRTLLTIAAAAGAFYFLLPQLAQVGSSWRAVQSADWAWLPLIIAFSALTYLASAVALMGAVPQRIRFWPTVLAQAASSFVNRVSPANVGGMALNARFLQKSGVDTSAGVAAVGVNSVAGAIVHLVLIVVFFTWAGRGLGKAFKLPSSSKLLLILAVVAAIAGIVLATRPGRRFAAGKLIPGLRSAAASLRRVAQNPGKMLMLFGGSALITLAYIGAFAASVQAFGGGPGVVLIGAVYLGAAAIAAAAPSPGGLGAIEAALVAGLTGVGMPGGTRRFRCTAVPAGHLLAARGAGLAVLARAAAAGVCMKPRGVLTTACIALTVVAGGLYGLKRSRLARSRGAGRPGTAWSSRSGHSISRKVSCSPQIYGEALAAARFPVRILPNLGSREVVDPALMDGLVQLVPEYAGSALEFFSLGRLSATADAAAANRALAGSVAGRGLVAARPAPAQDANAIVVTAATAARYGLRSIADLARAAPGLVFGGPPECPGRAYCLAGLKRVYGLRFKAFIPLDAGGPLTRQALEAGYIGVALLFTTDPSIPARHLLVLADDRGLQPAENITPLVRRDAIARYGPHLLALLNRVSALLDTGTLRALDARVELAGQDPRLVAGSWLRAHGLTLAAGDPR